MKIPVGPLLAAVLMTSGCASPKGGLVLAPVGPPSLPPAVDSSLGSLVVFSALDSQPHFNGFPYRHYYTDYKILSDDGKLAQKVRNDNGTSWEGPAEVQLPPGKYRVVARANGYGTVTVPVTVAAKQTTTVHLEGGTPIEREKTHLQTHSRAVNTETAQPPGS